MATFEVTVQVAAPIRAVYDQFTQFTLFNEFMEGVDRVEQRDDRTTHWVTSFGGVTREFDATITEQHPDERVAWRSLNGPEQSGEVTFERVDDATTLVRLRLELAPEGLAERVGAALGVIGSRVRGDLARFRDFIEARGRATGGWRGHIPH
jgi:uncharacterized membrane protein